MAQNNKDKDSGIGRQLGDLSPSKVVPVADELRNKQKQGRR
ncbi:hypothetical protein O7626_40355 [Micromonospora sp. WMMD1102]|nr:hypothetical protein [Micromonospora sp. WMMD1102]MDG4792071.1 hypothetical protein [Micromonospora sp. WMMD1102]